MTTQKQPRPTLEGFIESWKIVTTSTKTKNDHAIIFELHLKYATNNKSTWAWRQFKKEKKCDESSKMMAKAQWEDGNPKP